MFSCQFEQTKLTFSLLLKADPDLEGEPAVEQEGRADADDEAAVLHAGRLADVDSVEVIGGAWRTPKIQWILNQYFLKAQKSRNQKPFLELGQHLNGEESKYLLNAQKSRNQIPDSRNPSWNSGST